MAHEHRNYLSQYLYVKDEKADAVLGYLGDISEHGLMFITQLPVSVGATVDIVIENNIEGDGEIPLSARAKIKTVWKKPNLNPEMTCIGCALLEIDSEELKILKSLVSQIAFSQDVEIHRTRVGH